MEALVAIELADLMQVRESATKDLQQRGGWRDGRRKGGRSCKPALLTGVLGIIFNQPGGRGGEVANQPCSQVC